LEIRKTIINGILEAKEMEIIKAGENNKGMESQKNNGFYNRKEKRIRRRKKEILKL
jgi:hypothetical protein